MMMLFFAHIPFVVNHTINATPPKRLQHCNENLMGHTKPSTGPVGRMRPTG